MKKKKLIIFGASGFIGKNISLKFKKKFKNYQIIGTYLNNKPSIKGIKLVKCDLTKPKQVEKLIKNCEIIIQAAATT